MNPTEAAGLQRDDIVLYQSQTYLVTTATGNGYLLMLRGRYGNCVVPVTRCLLVYRAGEVPAGFTVGLLNAGEEAELMQVIQARIGKEQKNHAQEE